MLHYQRQLSIQKLHIVWRHVGAIKLEGRVQAATIRREQVRKEVQPVKSTLSLRRLAQNLNLHGATNKAV